MTTLGGKLTHRVIILPHRVIIFPHKAVNPPAARDAER